jgi:hypothetical protein
MCEQVSEVMQEHMSFLPTGAICRHMGYSILRHAQSLPAAFCLSTVFCSSMPYLLPASVLLDLLVLTAVEFWEAVASCPL